MSENKQHQGPRVQGLRHLALKVRDVVKSQAFYESLFHMTVVWKPDPENVYMSSGVDNLALHQIPRGELANYPEGRGQWLDHFGFIMDSPASVDHLYDIAIAAGVPILHHPKEHRDGSYSFYLSDPDRLTIQIMYEPNVSGLKFHS